MQPLSKTELAISDRIEQAPMLAQVESWSAINSGSRNLPGLARMADMLADIFSTLPGKVELVTGGPAQNVHANGNIEDVEHGRHLIATVRPDAKVQMLFTGHMDTVFGADHSFQNLRWLEDGVLNGPGVADMKGGIAILFAALQAIETSGAPADFGYQILINSDEEVGSPSSAPFITRLAQGKLAAFTYEPAMPDGTLAGARAGSGNFSIMISGKAAHAGRNPEDGRNALVAAADLAVRMKALMRDGLSVNPAKIDGGGPNNIVPNHAILRVNLRPRTLEMQDFATTEIAQLLSCIEKEHEVSVHMHGGFGRPPKPISNSAAALFSLVKHCGHDLGLEINWRDTGGVCDGNNIAACGIPVVDTMGVRGGNIHSSDEYLITDSLVERARLSALAISRLATKGSL